MDNRNDNLSLSSMELDDTKEVHNFTTPLTETPNNPFTKEIHSLLETTPMLSSLLKSATTEPRSAALLSQGESLSQFDFSQDFLDAEKSQDNLNAIKERLTQNRVSDLISQEVIEQPNKPEKNNNFRVLSISITGHKMGMCTLDVDDGVLEVSSLYYTEDFSTIDC